MFVLFDEANKTLGGRVLSETEASAQIELESGKRVKAKGANILLRFEAPAPAQLLAAARELADGVDLDLAWEFAPEGEFGFAELAAEYFGAAPGIEQQAAALLALQGAPHYFRRAGKGAFRKAPAEIVQQALAAIEKKKAQQALIAQWAGELAAGQCPQPVREQLYKILFKPDKNAPEYKAVVEASRSTHTAPLALLANAGAIDSPYQFHWQHFLFDNFPQGTGFGPLPAPAITDELPLAEGVAAFSIDDSQTTEIDDALSVQGLGTSTVTVGIHIAAPGLALRPGDAVDQVARQRLSTVYMPGHKITMLPEAVVAQYTLTAGRDCPAVSLYARFDAHTLQLQGTETRLERVPVVANLRHDVLDDELNGAWLDDPKVTSQNLPQAVLDLREQLSFLYRLAQQLKAWRELVRGKPEGSNRPDYSFRLSGQGDEPRGDERVEITTRQRGAPLDLIVSEAMILANSTWGQMLAQVGVPGIYRSQASLAPGIKVRMSTRALPHAGLGVKSYAWSTSPLRRYTDLVNQWQIIAAARHGQTAALAAPFKPKDTALLAILSAFDAAYASYNGYQNAMERFWTLRYLQQEAIGELVATIIKDQGNLLLVRADTLPLVFAVTGAQGLVRGMQVRVALGAIDLIALDLQGTVIERLEQGSGRAGEPGDELDEADETSGALAIALDVNEAEDAAANATPPASAPIAA